MNVSEITNRILCADCMEILPGLPDESVDFIFADPPYWTEEGPQLHKQISETEYWEWLENVVRECVRIAKNVIFKYSSEKVSRWCFHMPRSRLLIWHKPFTIPTAPVRNLLYRYEPLWLLKGKALRLTPDVFSVNSGTRNSTSGDFVTGHPTQIPITLLIQLIEAFTKSGDLVLDPFVGSGTTTVACVNLGRAYIGIDVSKEYCDISECRVKNAAPMLVHF